LVSCFSYGHSVSILHTVEEVPERAKIFRGSLKNFSGFAIPVETMGFKSMTLCVTHRLTR